MAELNITMSKSENKELDNTELINAINEMRANFTPETQNKVINLALRASFYVPAVMNKKTELVQGKDNRMKFEDKQTARFLLVSNSEKRTYFPAYTDKEHLKNFKTDQPFQGFVMRFGDLATLTEQTPKVEGFILNPDSEKLPFNKAMLANIKATLQELRRQQQAKAAEAAEKPNISVTTNPNPEE